MTIIDTTDDGELYLSGDVEPYEFWSYTTIVHDVVIRMLMDKMGNFRDRLITIFQNCGIDAVRDNKTAFGVKDSDGKIWYMGFKDGFFTLGFSTWSDSWIKPTRKSV